MERKAGERAREEAEAQAEEQRTFLERAEEELERVVEEVEEIEEIEVIGNASTGEEEIIEEEEVPPRTAPYPWVPATACLSAYVGRQHGGGLACCACREHGDTPDLLSWDDTGRPRVRLPPCTSSATPKCSLRIAMAAL